ncbi:hypothetical protein K1X45_01920 [Pseudochrobactrum sp. Wa41.01b-1]|uniref:HEPN/Toprim-associated domain-containing protein n=1 Tax=Pseudochrobactrum sp. Wa41.01b-1 TaxID=2864102 RepID=UPI001C693CE3|nr:HEPN/Toprim-associated domain-containing protein [Pseudochrobactrum sp. Wa41.01b-1]QYM73229.1 hypothetical protein K1X45_01920 [Pseudochrobactrum sp. Wa41.01b-1]
MGTLIELTVGGLGIDWSKNRLGNDHGPLFQDRDNALYNSEDGSSFSGDIQTSEYTAFIRPLSQVIPRLNLLGITIDTARHAYNANITQLNQFNLDNEENEVNYLSFDDYCELIKKFPIKSLDTKPNSDDEKSKKRFLKYKKQLERIPYDDRDDSYWSELSYFGTVFNILPPYEMLQVYNTCKENHDTPVAWEYGPIVEAGYVLPEEIKSGAGRKSRILIVTEGSSDVHILQHALKLLRPDIVDFFHFIDVKQRHPFSGTGNLVTFAEGLVKIDIENKVIFILDNDAEGYSTLLKMEKLNFPCNMRAMILPEIESFKDFITYGPDGIFKSNINKRAAAIECYLDLNLKSYPEAHVVWSNFKADIKKWHGALAHKDSYSKKFLKLRASDLANNSYDISKLEILLAAITHEAILIASHSQEL